MLLGNSVIITLPFAERCIYNFIDYNWYTHYLHCSVLTRPLIIISNLILIYEEFKKKQPNIHAVDSNVIFENWIEYKGGQQGL